MKLAKLQEPKTTIRFRAKLLRSQATEKIGSSTLLTLPKNASAKLPSRAATMVEGTINGFPFRAAVEPNGNGSHRLTFNKALHEAAGADAGDTVTVEITRAGEEPETRVPMDLRKALAATPPAQALWAEITPMARQNWILWTCSARQPETRRGRIEKACDMLACGKRRVCCFGGLNWLRKDHPTAGGTWLPLPDSRNRFSPGSTKCKTAMSSSLTKVVITSSILAVVLLAGCMSATRPSPSLAVVPRMHESVVIDGKLSEPCYASAPLVSEFVVAGAPTASPQPTRAWIFWDSERLVFAFDVKDADIVAAAESGREHDVDAQDRVELFLWSGRTNDTYYCMEEIGRA